MTGQVEFACGSTDGSAFEVTLPGSRQEIYLRAEGSPDQKSGRLSVNEGEFADVLVCSVSRSDCIKPERGYFTILGTRNDGFEGDLSVEFGDGRAINANYTAIWIKPSEPVFCG